MAKAKHEADALMKMMDTIEIAGLSTESCEPGAAVGVTREVVKAFRRRFFYLDRYCDPDEVVDWFLSRLSPAPDATVSGPPYIEIPLTFQYKNHRGEVAARVVFPISVRFGTTEWHPEAQWLLRAFDRDKQAEREFAMRDINPPAAPPVKDREAIAKEIFKNRQHLSDEDADKWFKNYVSKPEGIDHFRMAIWRAYSDADAILSLPVKSGAG